MSRRFRSGITAAALAAALWGVACGGGDADEAPSVPAVVENPVDPATAGTITGVIRFAGQAPAPELVNMSSDPYCERLGQGTIERVKVGPASGLENVFVYVKDGLGDLAFPVPTTAVVLDQHQCRYTPRVLGVQVGQPLEILSSDDTLHNVHAIPANNREFNRAHQQAGVRHTHVFSTTDVMVPFKCDVHKWMNAYVGVVDHPFHAVSRPDGQFELRGLPPGTYTIEAWHETLGTQTQTITVGEQQTSRADFTFSI